MRTYLSASFATLITVLALPLTASAASLSFTTPIPSTTIMPASNISFTLIPSGVSYPMFSLQDSFANSSASSNNIEAGGRFSWTPNTSDVGTHMITFTASGSDGATTAIQTIVVLPPPSMSIGPLSPGDTVLPGSTLTFRVSTTGFTNPSFTAGGYSQNISGASNGIDASGNFSWTPTLSDNGDHMITVYVSDALGHNASKSVTVHVGKGPSLSVVLLTPSASVKPGELVTFTVAPSDFSPTGFSVLDSFAGTASSNNVNLSGQFSWVPSQGDIGVHKLTITGVVGAYGASASTTQVITVLNPNGTTPVSAAAPSTSTDTLAALQAKLALLQGSLTTAQAGNASVSSGATFTSYLRPGASGDEVLRLQQLLSKLGFLTTTPNGNYGPATTKAVSKFQAAHGLEQLGVVGPATRVALNALSTPTSGTGSTQASSSQAAQGNGYVFEHFMGVGDDDPDVLQLQQRLVALGFYSGDITGYYGAATEAAVKKFQTARGITVTGYVARETRNALNK